MLLRLALYFRPHLFAVVFGVGFAWLVRWLSSMGGACRVLCYPPVTIAMGVIGGLLGAQLYRSEHPLPPRAGDGEDDPATVSR
jgi:predicted PurR-regulated permease PerM